MLKSGWVGLLLLSCCAANELAAAEENAIKSSPSEHKVNFGWPKFFNPEMGMMREKTAKKKASDKEKQEGNEVDTSHEDDEYESLIDYTLKGGLRGTLLLLNSTAMDDMGNLTSSEMGDLKKAAEKAMEEEEEESDTGGLKGEVTEEGVRLRTPLITKKHPPELGKYGAKISFYTDEQPTKFIYYGNWCGRGGRSAPVDDMDRCCLEHARCYGRTVRECPDVWKKPYAHMYAWTLLDGEVVCVRSEAYCVNHVCDCDRQAALCFQQQLSRGATHLGTKTA